MVSVIAEKQEEAWLEQEQTRINSDLPEIWSLLDAVCDPEIPVLTLFDLGVLTDIQQNQGVIIVSITPTYSGCPALETMRDDIISTLQNAGYENVRVDTRLTPIWTTDRMSPEGRRKLKNYGIAPPLRHCSSDTTPEAGINCPFCNSNQTSRLSEFGSTACKAMFTCGDCQETFDFFKNI